MAYGWNAADERQDRCGPAFLIRTMCCVKLTEFCSLTVNELAIIESWAWFMVCVTEAHGT